VVEYLVLAFLITVALVVVLARPRRRSTRGSAKGIDLLTVARGITLIFTVPQAILSLLPPGWWLLGAGLSALFEGSAVSKLGFFWVLVWAAPFVVLWFLMRDRHDLVALVLALEGLSMVPLAWDRHRQEFAWGFFLIAGLLAGVALALVAGHKRYQGADSLGTARGRTVDDG
jgi:hypothetical protein